MENSDPSHRPTPVRSAGPRLAWYSDLLAWPPLVAFVLALGIFALDLSLPGTAIEESYVAVVLVAWWARRRRSIVILSAFCAALVVAGGVLSASGSAPWMDAGDRALAVLVIGVTALLLSMAKRSNEALAESEARFRDFAGAASEWLWEMDSDLRFTYISDQFTVVSGIGLEEILGKTREELAGVAADDPEWRDHLADLRAHRPFRDFYYSRGVPSGRRMHFSVNGQPVFDSHGGFLGYRGTARNVTARVEAQEALRDSETRFRSLVEHLPLVVVLKDLEGRYLLVNRRFEEWYGVRQEEVLGKSVLDLFDEPHGEVYAAHDREVAEKREVVSIEHETRFADGSFHMVAATKFPVFGDQGQLVAIGNIDADVTELKNGQALLQAAKEEAELANRAKSDFLANMSHELRTPLNAIIGFAQLIEDQRLGPVGDPEYSDFAREIGTAGGHLLRLITDILDLSKIEAGALTLEEGVVAIPDAVRACMVLVAERAEAKGLRLETEIPEDLPPLRADGRKLKQILINLLANAVKFTSDGGRVAVEAGLGADRGLLIRVVDSGIGMSPDELAIAMTRFGQVDNSRGRRFQGTGLGLPLSRSLAELHGGSLEVESAPGAGTTVTVAFPASRVVAEPEARTA